ncbi:unnamed protein product, partial [Mesorhabditis belari]|uniref:Protein SPT2 homolog n=1 Tax=Mesorhabditis belari TaxID=2138241 RepID=A0AAF3FI73_9BILA
MDFERLLNHAKKNTEKTNREMALTKNELSEKKARDLQRIQEEIARKKHEQRRKQQEAEKAQQRKLEEAKKQYQIPKMKKPQESAVSKDQILAFKAKKEEERIKTEKLRLKEKEKLAELRLEANGGRANKKIARHFGIDAINMQIRYGKDHEHIELLQKRKSKEQEEQDVLAESLRGGVFKALQQRKKVEATSTKNLPTGNRPVGTSKANSLAGMSSRHSNNKDRFSPPRNGKKADSEKKVDKPIVKRPAPPPMDFSHLMAIASGKAKAPVDEKAPSTSKAPMQSTSVRITYLLRKRPEPHMEKSSDRKPTELVPMKKPKMDHADRREEPKPKMKHADRREEPKPKTQSQNQNGSFKKPHPKEPTKGGHQNGTKPSASASSSMAPPPPTPQPSNFFPSKRYLPGDIRYQPDQEPRKAPQLPTFNRLPQQPKIETKHQNSHQHPHLKKTSAMPMEKKRPKVPTEFVDTAGLFGEPERERRPAPSKQRPEMLSRNDRHRLEMRRRQAEKERERQYRSESMSLLEKERMRDHERRRTSMGFGRDEVDEWEDELDDEDDYDSEMDDFIDDSAIDDDRTTRRELEETMRSINKNYDKNLWRKREQMIDERSMETNFKQIDQEERRSRRMGLMEDVLEAKKGSSMAI